MPRAKKNKHRKTSTNGTQEQNTKKIEPRKNWADFSNIRTTGKARVYYNKKWYDIPLKDIEGLMNIDVISNAVATAIVHGTNFLTGIFGKKAFTDEDFELFEAEKFAAEKYSIYLAKKKARLSYNWR